VNKGTKRGWIPKKTLIGITTEVKKTKAMVFFISKRI
jgi:hypothetical protein